MKRCLRCKTEWPDSAKFCPKDGARLPDSSPATKETGDAPKAEAADQVALSKEDEAKLDQQRQMGFSETQWFMLAQNPEKLKDSPSTEDLYEMQEDYDWDDDVPEEERSRFSLRGRKKSKD